MAKPARSRAGMERFRQQNKQWLDDWALFSACRAAHGGEYWWKWETGLRLRRKPYIAAARKAFADEIAYHVFVQYQFDKQWSALKKYGATKGVGLIGDIPIFVAHDSCDVWANPELFRLDAASLPKVISGAAPDAFSKTGQLWEHPLYHWPRHKATGYDWWVKRFRHTLTQFDAVRVDHFLGFCRFWEIPYGDRNAKRGRWRKGPGADLFLTLKRRLGDVPIIVEDLGLLPSQLKDLQQIIDEKEGVVLLAMPADNGRTTTLYALVRAHDAYTSNVQTIESEKQASIEGVRQNVYDAAVDAAEFSTIVRSILRRDPDIVGVAEMPDEDTAKEIARADHPRTRTYFAMRGESALQAIQLYAKGVGDQKQAAESLHGVIAARLARKLCHNCRVAFKPKPEMLKKLGLPDSTAQLYRKGGQVLVKDKAQTCPVCSGNGFFGQVGVFEIHPIGKDERKLVALNDITGLRAAWRQQKQFSIQQAGIQHVVNGDTSIEEIGRAHV